ncbi:hypothetical protein QAD02_007112 [Eretmocerus hayati]|uniref:Uncharacterized protein n=1 Tax=Eretmocerus hayati TaxID=131215 RepID=A0ACC2N2Q2_9HYME|nr:hypothetical protein QAD02_007112 [Eretmocerus hayati]
MPSGLKHLCCYNGCTNSQRKNPDLSFHHFSSNPERRDQWFLLSGNTQLRGCGESKSENHLVCSAHFEEVINNPSLVENVTYPSLSGFTNNNSRRLRMMNIDTPALVHAEPPITDLDDNSTRSAGSSMPDNVDCQINESMESVENEPPTSTPMNTESDGMKRLENEL